MKPLNKKKIEAILKDPDLLVRTVEEIQVSGDVAGEEDTIISEIIIATTRLVKGVKAESKNLFLSDITGVGKDHVTKKTMEVTVPSEDNLHITKMTPETFTYWHRGDKKWNWDEKVIHIEDITESILNTSTFKVMASGGSYAAVVKDQKTIEIPINGKPVMLVTSYHSKPEDETLRRFPIGGLNNSEEQTRRIKDKLSKRYSGRIKKTKNIDLREALYQLKPYEVIILFAELIQHFFPSDIIMRTHYGRFLDYICSSAVFHQYQREKTEDGKLIATPDDYMIARLVLIYTTSNPKMIPMNRNYRDILQLLKSEGVPKTVAEIFLDKNCTKSKKWLYKTLPKLADTGLVIKDEKYLVEANKNVATYQFNPEINFNILPSWLTISQIINKLLQNTEKTENIEDESIEVKLLNKWFLLNGLKPKKPKEMKDTLNGDGFFLVLSGQKIHFNRAVFSVFPVISNFLHERDEKRYRKYYENSFATEVNKKKNIIKIGNKEYDLSSETRVRTQEELDMSEFFDSDPEKLKSYWKVKEKNPNLSMIDFWKYEVNK